MAENCSLATLAMSSIEVIPGLRTESHQRHFLHGDEMVWVEKNCYIDLWIELLHALKVEPTAMLPFTLAVDFEGDQWTFFKPSFEELRSLYGIDVQELTVWRPLLDHAAEHLSAGKFLICETDAFWLPDTAGTDYRTSHVKTSIVMATLDVERQRLGYFHNAGYFELSGEDFQKIFRIGIADDSEYLPLFAEVVRVDRLIRRPEEELKENSFDLLRRHFERRPAANPFRRFENRFADDLDKMQIRGMPHYHKWAFASVRQAGAAFELAASHLRWQAAMDAPALLNAAERFNSISQRNKTLILKGARSVNSGRPLDASPMILEMAQAWEEGMAMLYDFFNSAKHAGTAPSHDSP